MDEEIMQKATAEALLSDKALARAEGKTAFDSARNIEDQIGMFEGALATLVYVNDDGIEMRRDDGARTGWMAKNFPSANTATSQFRTIANKLGISVINMATFGALSEREMKMAMATNLDENLPEEELIPFIREMIAAKQKLARAFYDKSQQLALGSGSYQEWQNDVTKLAIEHDNHRYSKLSKNQIKGLQGVLDNPDNDYKSNMTTRDLWATYNLDIRKQAFKGQ